MPTPVGRGHAECDSEEVGFEWPRRIEFVPGAPQDQEHFVSQVLHITRCDAQTLQRPHEVVELTLVGIQAGIVNRDGRHAC